MVPEGRDFNPVTQKGTPSNRITRSGDCCGVRKWPQCCVGPLLALLALVGAVIVIAALLSGWVDRTGVPQVAVFLAMGALIGPIGLGLVDASVDSPILRVVATLSLVLVLFTDAVSLDLKEVRQH